jgi:hypothetical protein
MVVSELEHDEWYSDIIYYQKNLTCPNHLVDYKRRALRLESMKYCLTQDGLGWKNPDGVLLICVNKDEVDHLLKELHSGYYGGHFTSRTTTHNILRAGYYWPTIFTDTHRYVRSCTTMSILCRKTKTPCTAFESCGCGSPFPTMGPRLHW